MKKAGVLDILGVNQSGEDVDRDFNIAGCFAINRDQCA